MHLQCFPPTRYVRGGASRAHKRDDLYQLWTKLKFRLPACIVWLYYASSSTMWWFLDFFSAQCVHFLLHTKYKKIGGFGSTWERTFYMSTHNGLKNEIILIHALELKLQHFEVSPCLYREATHLQCFESRCALFRKTLGQYSLLYQLILYQRLPEGMKNQPQQQLSIFLLRGRWATRTAVVLHCACMDVWQTNIELEKHD